MANNKQVECPNCHRLVEAAEYCPHCGGALPKLSKDNAGGADALISGYGNAVSELNNVHNTDSHDTHVTNTYVNNLSGEADKQRRRDEYKTFCEPILSDGLVTKEERMRLEAKARELKLTTYEAEEIENNVRRFTAAPRRMNQIQEETFNYAVSILESDGDAAKAYKILKPLVDKGFDDDGVSYHYYMAASLQSPSNYLRDYERSNNRYFSYWQSFWAYFAYKKKGEDINANKVMQDLAEAKDYPESNAVLLYVVDRICDQLASPSQSFDKSQLTDKLDSCDGISNELYDLKATLEYAMKYIQGGTVPMSNSGKYNLYLKLLGVKKNQQPIKEVKPAPQPQPNNISKSYGLSDAGVDIADRQIRKPNPPSSQPTTPPVQHQTPNTQPSQHQVSNNTSNNNNTEGWWKGCLIFIIFIALIVWGVKSCIRSCTGGDEKDNIENVADTVFVNESDADEEQTKTSKSSSSKRRKSSNDDETSERSTNYSQQSTSQTNHTTTNESNQTNQQTQSYQSTPTQQSEPTKSTTTSSEPKQETTTTTSAPTANQLLAKGKALDGSSRTIAQAIGYYQQAANMGNAEAMYRLGCAYSFGNAATKDLGQAEKWFNRAISSGVEPWVTRSKSKKVNLGIGGI